MEADDLVIPDFGAMSNLKYVVIENLHGRASEIAFIKFLVGNVFVLENICLKYAPAAARVGIETIHSFHRDLKHLYLFPPSSPFPTSSFCFHDL